MVSVAAPLVLRAADGARLRALTRASAVRAGHAQRARMLLLAADGQPNAEIARRVGVTRQTVVTLRSRYVQRGLDALADLPRSGRPPVIDEAKIVIATLNPPPASLGVTHWSARLMANHLRQTGAPISFAEVARIWRDWGLQPHRIETFTFSTDPALEAKVRDVVGLYLDPPANAVVVCVDEKSQALDRSQPVLPMMPGMPDKRTHDYARNGITSLFAALDMASGKVIGALHRRHRSTEYRKFLIRIDKAVPADLDVHIICDNYTTHKTDIIQRWLVAHPRFHVHFIPTSSSWLNPVERWFGELTSKLLQRGVHKSIQALEADIRAWIETWNEDPRPYVWTKTADEILDSIAAFCQRTSNAGHELGTRGGRAQATVGGLVPVGDHGAARARG